MRCNHCGKEIDRDSEFCKYCGGTVSSDFSAIETPGRRKKSFSFKSFFWKALPFAFLCFILWPGHGIIPPLSNNNAEAASAAVASSSQPITNKASSSRSTTPPPSKGDPLISYTEYVKIETGMTYDEVCKIIGSYGREMARSEIAGYQSVVVGWEGEGMIGANANVTFQNGKVMAKAQAGLQ